MSPSPLSTPTHQNFDTIFANPPFGAGFLLEAPMAAGEALEALPEAEPTLWGVLWIKAEFDRLRALPFAASSAGSETNPPVRARDVVLSARIRRRAFHLAAAAGTQWPTENRITITAAPDASRAEVSETLLHELVHAANCAPIHVITGRRLVHDYYFREALIEAAKQAYGLDLPRGAARWRASQVDDHLVRELEALGGEWDLALGK